MTTNDAGNYLISALLPGRYRIIAEAPGFKQMKREAVTLAVDQVARLDFTMEVGETRESMTVEASAVLLDSANSTIGTVVENRQVIGTPAERTQSAGSCWRLAAGIRIQGGFGGKNGSWGNFSSNGGLANANSVMVEGLALDLAQMNSPSFVPPVDATAGIPRSDQYILGGVRPHCRRCRQLQHQVRHERVCTALPMSFCGTRI